MYGGSPFGSVPFGAQQEALGGGGGFPEPSGGGSMMMMGIRSLLAALLLPFLS